MGLLLYGTGWAAASGTSLFHTRMHPTSTDAVAGKRCPRGHRQQVSAPAPLTQTAPLRGYQLQFNISQLTLP